MSMKGRKAAWAVGLCITIAGCPSDDAPADTDTDTDATTAAMPTSGADASATDGVDDSTGDPTGGPGSGLMPCNPTVPEACAEGVCAGAPQAGFYCRPACSDMAEEGTSCGAGDVCLPVGAGNDGLACFDVSNCDLLTGDGCDVAGGESCVAVSLEPVRTACVPSGTTPIGQSCDPLGMHDCAVGSACLASDIADGDPGVCTQLCLPADPLPDGCSTCTPLNADIGTCTECSVLDDQCPDGQQCQPTNEFLGGACIDHGDVPTGGQCIPFDPTMSCVEGNLCFETEVDDVFACVATCDPMSGACVTGEPCVDLGVIVPGADPGQVGVCVDTGAQLCDPDAMPTGCAAGDICLQIEQNLGLCGGPCDPTDGETACGANEFCIPEQDGMLFLDPFGEGNGACGSGCTSDAQCGGGTCLLVDGLSADGICGTTCDPAMGAAGCGAGENCVPTTADPMVGACVAGGAACDPMLSAQCAPSAGACVALDGGASGACMMSCFVQDPNACGGVVTCNEKTGAQWHGGVCLGGGRPCDPIAQDCGPMQTCDVQGGGPIGGTAFVCDDAGMLPVGGNCAADDGACGPGLFCFADVCVAACDPAVGGCAMGTCTDLSDQIYLPANSFGLCL